MRAHLNAELLRSALDGLRSHKLRSGLTALGVIFGVAAVIGMASIGEGAKREALEQIKTMGASNIIIDEARPDEEDARKEAVKKNPAGLTVADAEALREIIGEAELIVPQWMADRMVRAGSAKSRMHLVATTPDIFVLQNNILANGRWFTQLDAADTRRVCVLGGGAKRELFPLRNAVGELIEVEGQLLTVVGVLDRVSVGGEIEGYEIRDLNRDIYMPLATALKRFPHAKGETELHRIVVKLPEIAGLTSYSRLIERILKRRHYQADDFTVTVPEELLQQHQATQRIFNIVMGAIASISLLVGGIGIMNIMLASVLERTREIGVRRALGARQADIARQFLAEAVLLSVSGGFIGVIAGILLAKGISLYADWGTAVSAWAILVAVGVSVSVGIIFGYLPARRAAKLDPIAALRFE